MWLSGYVWATGLVKGSTEVALLASEVALCCVASQAGLSGAVCCVSCVCCVCRVCPLPLFSQLFLALCRVFLAVPPLICSTRLIRRSDRQKKKRITLKSPGYWHASRNREIGGRTNLSALVWPCLAQVISSKPSVTG